jgi:uncharacterized protein YaaQ
LVLSTVAAHQVRRLVERLTHDGFYVTEIDSRRGILYESTVTLLIGLHAPRLSRCLDHLRECCHTRRQYIPTYAEPPMLEAQSVMIEAETGGATVFVFPVERFEQI